MKHALLALLASAAPFSAAAATIHVDTTVDAFVDDGNCSLREAIDASNRNQAVDGCTAGTTEMDEIVLGPGTYTLALAGKDDTNAAGDYDIRGYLTIRGAGADTTILDGAQLDRIFDIHDRSLVVLQDLTLTNGRPPVASDGDAGSTDAAGGAIRSVDLLEIHRCVLEGNAAGEGAPGSAGGDGGAIHTTRPLYILDSVLRGNVTGRGGATTLFTAPGSGGAIFATSNVGIDSSRIESNNQGQSTGEAAALSGGRGAAVSVSGRLVLRDSSVADNGRQGLAANGVVWAGGELVVSRTSFVGNRAFQGSAIDASAGGQITNALFLENEATAPSPRGAIHASSGWPLEIHSSTLTGNRGGGLFLDSPANVKYRNSIIAGNLEPSGAAGADCGGGSGLMSHGQNLHHPGTTCPAGADDVLAADTGLGSPTNSERFIPTYLPLTASSPAVDTGSCSPIIPQTGSSVTDDIVGKARPSDSPCDIGAFEHIEKAVLFRVTPEPPGPNCDDGGSHIAIGVDENVDQFLGDAEVTTELFLCNGADGEPGEACTVDDDGAGNAVVRCPDGTTVTVPAGSTSLLRLVEESPGANCAAGGQRVETGIDANRNGVLDPDEVDSTAWICNGSDGADGTDGANGKDAESPASCSVKQSADGGARITCPDGSVTTVEGPAAPGAGGCSTPGSGTGALGLIAAAALAARRRPR